MADYMEIISDGEVCDIIDFYNSKYGSAIKNLKPLQHQALSCIVDRNSKSGDLICMLPTGYGKSLIYELVPLVLEKKFDQNTVMLVLEPLNVIIEQQLSKLGSSAMSICENMKESDLKKLTENSVQYIYSHPEHIIGNKEINNVLSSDSCQSRKCVIVVDEAHCVLDWGEEYRPMFSRIRELRAVLPDAKLVALSATLSQTAQRDVAKVLLMRNMKVVASQPTRENISLVVMRRPPLGSNISSKDTYDYVFLPLLNELKLKGQKFPLTIVYCSGSMDWVGYGFEVSSKILGTDMHVGNKSPENQRVVMYHSSIEKGDKLKDIIFKNLSKPPCESPLKLVFATIALGMGADLQHVERVIHVGSPMNMEAYIQQVGRAGRNGKQCIAVIFFNNSDLGRQGVSKSVKDFCKNDSECRKTVINAYFGFTCNDSMATERPLCCDVCNEELKSEWHYETPMDERKKCVLRQAIQTYVQASKLEKVVLPAHVEKLVFNALFYTDSSAIEKDFTYPCQV
ncbi:ATP-dependent DNA helicase Q1-like [Saccostrea cucullata]|uniref:ATP-dependent DNA helicase Q1-like n=1 Tax=Saccostrea cuccullata TaxID=36930 RepID=UPI002ED5A876